MAAQLISTSPVGDCLCGLSDRELLRRAGKRDRDAWETLIRRHARLVNGLAARYELGEYERADVFQEVWTELWNNRDKLSPKTRCDNWLVLATARTAGRKASGTGRSG